MWGLRGGGHHTSNACRLQASAPAICQHPPLSHSGVPSSPPALPRCRYDELLDAALQHYQQRHRRPAQWGAFESIAVDGPQLTAWLLRHAVALRTRLRHLPYGDQAIFVRRTTFNDKVGGYWEQPLLEDVDLVQRLRRSCGPPALLSRPLATSGRRWQQLGLLRTTLVNQAILLGWRLGVPVPMLAACYRQGMRQPRKS